MTAPDHGAIRPWRFKVIRGKEAIKAFADLSYELRQASDTPFDEEKLNCLTDVNCENPQPTAYPSNPVFVALNKDFAEEAPQLKAFFDKNEVPLEVINETLAEMEDSGDDSIDVAKWFLAEYPEVWTNWVPEDVAERVQSSL